MYNIFTFVHCSIYCLIPFHQRFYRSFLSYTCTLCTVHGIIFCTNAHDSLPEFYYVNTKCTLSFYVSFLFILLETLTSHAYIESQTDTKERVKGELQSTVELLFGFGYTDFSAIPLSKQFEWNSNFKKLNCRNSLKILK